MRRYLLMAGLALGLATSGAAQKPPTPKSKEEVTALQAMFNATDPDAQITAANTVLEKFADTEFKSIALQVLATDYQRKGDFPKAVTFGERALEADPKNYQAMLVLAGEYASNTKDADFDKEDKLKKADKYANDAISAVKDAPKPNPSIADAQWDGAKKDLTSQAHEILGQTAMIRKKPDVAATEFQTAISVASTQEASPYVRLAQADNQLNKYDEAIAASEKAMNMPNAQAQVKQFAQAQRAFAMQAKNKSGAAPPAGSTPATSAAPASSSTPTPTPAPSPTPEPAPVAPHQP